jgi:hypothetical protein
MKAGNIEKRQITLAKSDLEFMSGRKERDFQIDANSLASAFGTDMGVLRVGRVF